ncbi:MAG: AEC family transporter [Firmicutes bacterium]|nr:AEC family transporter [Bacillota bacterium]
MDFTGILTALFKLVALLAIGFVIYRKKYIDEHFNRGLSWLVVNITNPCLIIGSLASAGDIPQQTVMKLVVYGIGYYVMLPFLAALIVRVTGIRKEDRGTAALLAVFSNTGFMAIPIMQTLYGDMSIFVINILNLPFNFLVYTYGIYLIQKDIRAKQEEKLAAEGQKTASSRIKLDWKLFLTPGIVASIIALILYFFKIQMPQPLTVTFRFIGDVTPPLTMLLLGAVLAESPIADAFTNVKLDLAMLLKLFLMPLLAFVSARLVFDDPVIIGITVLTFAMPCGTMGVMLSKNFGGNTRMAAGGIFFSTIVSLITIPLVYFILSKVLI